MSSITYLHGFTGAPSSWDAVRAARLQMGEELLPTLLGHGSSGDGDAARSLEAEADRLAAAASTSATSGERILAGYSLGARIGLGILIRHPELFRAAILVGGQPALESESEKMQRARDDEFRAKQLETAGLDAFVSAWETLPLFDSQRELPPQILLEENARRRSHKAKGLALSLRCHGLAQMPWDRAALRKIRARVLLLAGARDDKFSAIARETAQLIPHARAEIVEGAGHNILLERPEVVARALEAT